jgi:hypothetical protein
MLATQVLLRTMHLIPWVAAQSAIGARDFLWEGVILCTSWSV